MRILISSTQADLAAYRLAAEQACRQSFHDPVFMEDLTVFSPSRESPEHACAREVRKCGAIVVLIAHKYGTLVPGRDISYTELEYETALAQDGVEILAYTVDAREWSLEHIDGGKQQKRLERFKKRVGENHLKGTFSDPEQFRGDLMAALNAMRMREAQGTANAAQGRNDSTPARISGPAVRASRGASAVLRLESRGGEPFTVVSTSSGPEISRLDEGDVPADVQVAVDGSVLAHLEGDLLRVAWLNRSSASADSWPEPVSLGGTGVTDVLAVSASGHREVLLVGAGPGGTQLLTATQDGSVGALAQLSDLTAGLAVLFRGRVLLALPVADRLACPAFPGLVSITSLAAAHSAGRLIVVAAGLDRQGLPAVHAEVDGQGAQPLTDAIQTRLLLSFDPATEPRILVAGEGVAPVATGTGARGGYRAWTVPNVVALSAGHESTP